jgi:2-polyprenyl-3-methyl-5-hydroxy-6-metoxy-1,4-benzoquinol methylase
VRFPLELSILVERALDYWHPGRMSLAREPVSRSLPDPRQQFGSESLTPDPTEGFGRVGATAGTCTLYDLPELYDAIVRPGPCEAFYCELARRIGGPVLELACGTGRLTLPLAREGHEVVGLDASPRMLAVARRRAQEAGLALSLVQGLRSWAPFRIGRHLL